MTSAVKIKKKDGGASEINNLQQREGVLYTRNLILRAVSAVYLIAFVTFYHQSSGKFIINFLIILYFYLNKKNTYRPFCNNKNEKNQFILKITLFGNLILDLNLCLSLFIYFVKKISFRMKSFFK